MSSKTRKTTVTTTSSTSQSTSVAGGSQTGQSKSSARKSATPQPSVVPQESSPTSPTKFSRIQEKAELASLNDRLACYIDRVRHLETENGRLTREITTHEETLHREVTTIKTMYENELADARALLDEMSREKAKLEINYRRNHDEKLELSSNLDARTKELQLAQTALSNAEARLSDITGKYCQAQNENKKLADELKALEREKKKLANQVAETRKMLEEETLHRVDMENAIQTAKEELSFKEQMFQQQMSELKTKRQVEISEIDGRLTQQYEEKLYESLQEIRDQYEIDLNSNKEEVKLLYEEKIKSLVNQLNRSNNASTIAMEEMRKMQTRTDVLVTRVAELESENNEKNQQLKDLEKQLEIERRNFMEEVDKLNRDITKLRNGMANQLQDYQDLMDTKVALDMEIAVYRKLLEGEEARLNITPVSSPTVGASPRRIAQSGRGAKKRKLGKEESEETTHFDYTFSTTSKGDIEVMEICPDGKYVKLKNKGTKELSLSGWQLIRKAGDASTVFKFARNIKIDAGSTVTVWSSDAQGHVHEPPENITMKGQKWVTGDLTTTALLNNQGEEVANGEQKKQLITSSVSRQRDTGGFFRPRTMHSTQMLHGDVHEEERCCIM